MKRPSMWWSGIAVAILAMVSPGCGGKSADKATAKAESDDGEKAAETASNDAPAPAAPAAPAKPAEEKKSESDELLAISGGNKDANTGAAAPTQPAGGNNATPPAQAPAGGASEKPSSAGAAGAGSMPGMAAGNYPRPGGGGGGGAGSGGGSAGFAGQGGGQQAAGGGGGMPAGYPAPGGGAGGGSAGFAGQGGGQQAPSTGAAGGGGGMPAGYPAPGGGAGGGSAGFANQGGAGGEPGEAGGPGGGARGGMRPGAGPGGPGGGEPGAAGGAGGGRGGMRPGGPGPGMGGPGGGGNNAESDFTTPQKGAESFLSALESKDTEKLAEALAKHSEFEATNDHKPVFQAMLAKTADAKDVDQLATAFAGMKVVQVNPPKQSGLIHVVVGKQEDRKLNDKLSTQVTIIRTLYVRHEKDGWKVQDFSGARTQKSAAMPTGGQSGGGRRR